ncbi:MAG: addiction module antidote protein [Acidobacteriaceae bacterium]
MNTIFIGGSRHISRLPAEIKDRLNKVIDNRHCVLVGDANGADKAIQKHFADASYDKVSVFCTGEHVRNNLGHWPTHNVEPPHGAKGFQFYAAKDREMATKADFGLMIWDGKSPGTLLNVLRLAKAGKISVLYNAPEKRAINIAPSSWESFLSHCSDDLRSDLKARATPEEWEPVKKIDQSELFTSAEQNSVEGDNISNDISETELGAAINSALATSDPAKFVDALGAYARRHGMTQIARKTGLARESLYRALSSGGNPEFSTVLRVVSAIGFRLEASKIAPESKTVSGNLPAV